MSWSETVWGRRRVYLERFVQVRRLHARETGNRGGEGVSLGNLGTAYAALKQMEQAIHERFDSLRAQAPPRANPDIGAIAARGPGAQIYSDPDGQTRVSLQTVVYTDPGPDTRASRAQDISLYVANGMLTRASGISMGAVKG